MPQDTQIDIQESVLARNSDAVRWERMDQDIAETLSLIRHPCVQEQKAEALLRSLLAIAKLAAYSAGAQYGLNLGEVAALKAIRETHALMNSRGMA